MFTSNHFPVSTVRPRQGGLHGRSDWLRLLFVCCLLTVAFAGSVRITYAAQLWLGLDDRALQLGFYQRTYHVHLPPSYTGTTALPLVMAFHGAYNNGRGMAGLTNFNNVADRFGFIAVYPDALNGVWNADGTGGQDDVAFVSAMLQQLSSTLKINPHRLYAMGFSSGAVFSEEVGCRLGSKLAAVASVAGHMTSDFAAKCAPGYPLPVITFHGTADPWMSFAGWADAAFGQRFLGATGDEDKWASLAACVTPAMTTSLPDTAPLDGTTVQRRVRSGCAAGAEMQLYIVNNGGHTWPGGLQYWPDSIVGKTSRDIDASTVIWQFFARFQR